MNKKVLYISTVESGPFEGVFKKMSNQCKAFEELGYEVTHLQSGIKSFFGQIGKLFPTNYGINYRIIKKQVLALPNDSYSYSYVRFSPASRGLIDVLKTIKKSQKGIKIILEIPTFPYDDELKGFKNFPFKVRDRIYRTKIKRYVDLIVTPSFCDEKNIYGTPALEITNGICLTDVRRRFYTENKNKDLILIGVALLTPKQGYDRIINGIYDYVSSKGENDPDIYFYIIGDGSSKNYLQELTLKLNLQKFVIFTNQKSDKELDEYFNMADLGIGTLALHRTGESKKTNSLKTREYCARGLPFVITNTDYVFADNNFEFCFVIDESDESVNMSSLFRFVNDLVRHYSYDAIIENMASFAKKHINWASILEKIINRVDSF